MPCLANRRSSAGYSSSFVDNTQSADVVGYVRNIGMALFSPTRGLLVWSPFLIVLLPGLPAAWRAAPSWVRGGALGGLVYLLVQYKANRYSGGDGFAAYRYPLEALTASAPLLLLSYTEWVAQRPRVAQAFRVLVILSVVAHAAFAIASVTILFEGSKPAIPEAATTGVCGA